jgi:hypothetical protein
VNGTTIDEALKAITALVVPRGNPRLRDES